MSTNSDAEILKATVEQLSEFYVANNVTCQVCNRPSQGVGCFSPNAKYKAAYDAPAGKTRAFFYPVCQSCFENPAALEILEDLILKNYCTEH